MMLLMIGMVVGFLVGVLCAGSTVRDAFAVLKVKVKEWFK